MLKEVHKHFSPAGNDGDNSSGAGASDEIESTGSNDFTTSDRDSLLDIVNKERTKAEDFNKKAKNAAKQLEEATLKLEKLKEVDIDKYNAMLDRQAKADEESLRRQGNWDTLKANYQAASDKDKSVITELSGTIEGMKVHATLEKAFRLAGGIEEVEFDGSSAEEIQPIDLVSSYLKSRLKVVNSQVVVIDRVGEIELNKDGTAKTVSQKMIELKTTTLGHLFKAENNNSGGNAPVKAVDSNGRKTVVFTKEQAATGKADIEAIANGTANVR
jgi:hypothetical protein